MFCFEGVNQSAYDRLLRAFLAMLMVLAGLFWFSSPVDIILYVIALALFINAITGVCGLYSMLGVSTLGRKKESIPKWLVILFLVVIVIVLVIGILTRIFLN